MCILYYRGGREAAKTVRPRIRDIYKVRHFIHPSEHPISILGGDEFYKVYLIREHPASTYFVNRSYPWSKGANFVAHAFYSSGLKLIRFSFRFTCLFKRSIAWRYYRLERCKRDFRAVLLAFNEVFFQRNQNGHVTKNIQRGQLRLIYIFIAYAFNFNSLLLLFITETIVLA